MCSSDLTVAVIGGGAAGLTAAHFLVRAGLHVDLYDQDRSILKRARLLNLPGAVELEGRELLAQLRAKLDEASVTTRAGKVDDVVPDGGRLVVRSEQAGDVTADYVVLATGQGTLRLASLPLETTEARQPFVKQNVVTDRWGATSVPGVYACGVLAGWPSQAVVCAGSGAAVAVEIATAAHGAFWVDHDDTRLAPDPE